MQRRSRDVTAPEFVPFLIDQCWYAANAFESRERARLTSQ
jgi:hypothetical protein